MKKLLFLFILSLAFGAAKAQMTITQLSGDYSIPAPVYTDNGNSWEITYTDLFGTTYDFNWSLSSNILSYTCTVTSGTTSDLIGLHDVYFYDENTSTTLMEDDYEGDGMGYDFGSNVWNSSGSFDVSTLGATDTIDIHLDGSIYDNASSSWNMIEADGTLKLPL